MAISSGVVSVGTSATAICVSGEHGVLLQNLGTVAVTIGGASVTTTTGVTLPASMTSPIFVPGMRGRESLSVPAGSTDVGTVFGVSGTAGQNVAFLSPEGG